MTAFTDPFRTRLRNRSTHMCIGNGMEGNGMEEEGNAGGDFAIHSSGSVTRRDARLGWMGANS